MAKVMVGFMGDRKVVFAQLRVYSERMQGMCACNPQ